MTSYPMHRWASDLWPMPRSLTGQGVRDTLAYLQGLLPDLRLHSIATGETAFDWTVPDEWTIRDAYIADLEGARLVDFRRNNLHLMGYSAPVNAVMTRAELEPHLHVAAGQPDAIPYVTSYYARRWGFCLSERQKEALGAGPFQVVVDATLAPGRLDYAELVIPGRERSEVMFSTYVCHPSMANNELSGPVVAAALAQWVSSLPDRRHTYRFVFAPETLGALVYLSRNLDALQERLVAGYVLTCVGDERAYSFMPSRRGDTLADRVARHVLARRAPGYVDYSFLDRGSDERQFCAPLIDLPVCSIMRTKYGAYPEYHTSLDDLTLVTQAGLEGALACYQDCVRVLEANRTLRVTVHGEPQLGRRGLYPDLSTKGSADAVRSMMNFIAYSDGRQDILTTAELIGADALDCAGWAEALQAHGLMEHVTD